MGILIQLYEMKGLRRFSSEVSNIQTRDGFWDIWGSWAGLPSITQEIERYLTARFCIHFWHTVCRRYLEILWPKVNSTLLSKFCIWLPREMQHCGKADSYLAIMFKPFALTLSLKSNMVSFSGVTEDAAYKTDGSWCIIQAASFRLCRTGISVAARGTTHVIQATGRKGIQQKTIYFYEP